MAEVKAHTSYAGIAFRPGDRELWASETGERGSDALLMSIAVTSDGGAVAVDDNEQYAFNGPHRMRTCPSGNHRRAIMLIKEMTP